VHFRKIAKIAKFPNLARARRALINALFASMQIFLFTQKISRQKKFIKKFFYGESATQAPPPKLHAENCNGHSGACRKDGVNYL
jgi:hypothetical protein